MLNTPILFLVFNRPDTTKRVFEQIRKIQPQQLFVAADGPRTNKEGEKEKTEAVRKLILDRIDWDCEVKTLFREDNLGCERAVSQAITWFFEHVEQGIILEDDTLPDLSFFRFCEELLEKYKDDERITMISGYCKFGKYKSPYSYSFTKGMGGIWGWATWRRAWNYFDFEMEGYPEYRQRVVDRHPELPDFIKNFDGVYHQKINSWAYRWAYKLKVLDAFAIRSNVNLIKNIGFGATGTHITDWQAEVYEPSVYHLKFPLKHPIKLEHEVNYVKASKKCRNNQQRGLYSQIKMIKVKFKHFIGTLSLW